jgi:hypothetical protein
MAQNPGNNKKVCLIGPPLQGKTSILRASVGAAMPQTQRASVQEENVKVYLLDSGDITDQAGSAGQGVVFHTWSLPGQQAAAPVATNIYMHNASFYRHAIAAVITLDCTTFDESIEDLEAAASNGGFNPLAVGANLAAAARRTTPEASVFLCLTKCDLLKGYSKGKTALNPIDPKVRSDNARIFANAQKFINENQLHPTLISTSALDRSGISNMYSIIYQAVLEKQRRREAEAAAKRNAESGGAGAGGANGAGGSAKPAVRVNLDLATNKPPESGNRCVCKSG